MGAQQDDRQRPREQQPETTTFEALQRSALFPLGRLVITGNASQQLTPADILTGISRHAQRDWGEVTKSDRRANDEALLAGERILSVYSASSGRTFWILTEADRSATTVLLPEDY